MVTATVTAARAGGSGTSTGFTRDSIQFLADLADHNDRTWFAPRKGDYERLLKDPLEALCVALDERFRAAGIPLRADPRTSPFRIYRDVRFSKDKAPYKTHVAASFAGAADRLAVKDRHASGAVGGYFSFAPGQMSLGGGRWQPAPATMAAWRAMVVERNAEVHAALEQPAFVRTFGRLVGDTYRRVPAGSPADHPDAELLKLRQLLFSRHLSDAEVLSTRLPDTITKSFLAALPLMVLLGELGGEEAPAD